MLKYKAIVNNIPKISSVSSISILKSNHLIKTNNNHLYPISQKQMSINNNKNNNDSINKSYQKIQTNNPSHSSNDSSSGIWNGFHKKSVLERQHQLRTISRDIDIDILNKGGLEIIRADSMVENCIGLISLPVGLGLHFKINGKSYSVPMAVEEPSIIAATSAIAKLVGTYGGFFSVSDPSNMTTQLHIIDTNTDKTVELLKKNKDMIINTANNYCQKMVQRGGGVKGINIRVLKPGNDNEGIICLDIIMNVCESMGANSLNTVAEGVSIFVEDLLNKFSSGRVLMKILSNLSVLRKTTTEFKIPVKAMAYKGLSGKEVCYRIIKSHEIACLDPFRTTTHNKGIMNGIDAVALALGQDWRAIESGCHAYSALKELDFNKNDIENDLVEYDRYKSMTYYKILEIEGEEYLYGRLRVPMALGVVGGPLASNPNYSNLYKILGKPTSGELASIMTAVGLSNNLAAMRALVCTGIQVGHMALHSKNVAIRAGVPDKILLEVVEFMKNSGSITEDTAKNYLDVSLFYL